MEYFQFRLACVLPTEVVLGKKTWRIKLSYGEKGRFAALVATCGKECGEIIKGRTREVESALGRPISVPVGTTRHQLARELIRTGRAVAPGADPWDFS